MFLLDTLGVNEQHMKILQFDPKTPLHSKFTTSCYVTKDGSENKRPMDIRKLKNL